MIDITATERTRVLSELGKIRAAMHKDVLDVYKGFIVVAFNSVLTETPQWTGHAAAQWNIGINSLDSSRSRKFLAESSAVERAFWTKGEIADSPDKYRGHPEAVNEAQSRQAGKVETIRLADTIFISNNAESLLTGEYITKLEENPNNYLREANEPGHMVQRTVEWFNSRVAQLTPEDRLKFKLVKISDSGFTETF